MSLSKAAEDTLNEILDECNHDPFVLYSQYDTDGICGSCGEVGQFAEPDAEGYTCDCCGEPAVMGMANAVMELI